MSNQQIAEKKPSRLAAWLAPVREYLIDTWAELNKVKWPNRQQVRNLTVVVLAVTFAMSFFLGLFDFGFEQMFFGILSPEPSLIAIAVAVVIVLAIVAIVLFASRDR
jgi:preprotein translocase SecE subunit